MATDITQVRTWLERQKGKRALIVKNIETAEAAVVELQADQQRHEAARVIIREVGLKTQQQLQYCISDIASMALDAVFDDPYKLVVDFVLRHNKTECDLYFERDGHLIDPLDSSGGGAADVGAFALRVSSWSMMRPRPRNVLLLDEPFKHLKGETENRRMLEMLRKISQQLKLQIIMVSDERISRDATVEATDRLFEAYKQNGVTKFHVS